MLFFFCFCGCVPCQAQTAWTGPAVAPALDAAATPGCRDMACGPDEPYREPRPGFFGIHEFILSNLATSVRRCDDSDPGRQRCWTWPARPRSPSLIGRCVSCRTMWGSLKPAAKGVEKIWKGLASWINMANVISFKLKPDVSKDNLEFVLFLWRKSTEAFQASKGRRMSSQISKGQHFNDGLKK